MKLLLLAAIVILVKCAPQDVSFPEDFDRPPPPNFMPEQPIRPQSTRPQSSRPQSTRPQSSRPQPTQPSQGGSTPALPSRTSPSVATPDPATSTTTRIPPRDNANRLVFTVSCPCNFTRQYSPVCGTDGQTYGNKGVMDCAAFCGTNVSLFLVGACGRNNG